MLTAGKCRHTVKVDTEVLLFANKKTGVERRDRSCKDEPFFRRQGTGHSCNMLTNRLENSQIQIHGNGIKKSAFVCRKKLTAH